MKNLLITLANKNYVRQAKQLFSSIYFNAGWDGDCMLLAYDIPDPELTWFEERGILVKKCTPFYEGKIGYNPNPVLLIKLSIFAEEFKQWDQIIFLDGDIIVRDSLDYLTTVKGLGAVRIINDYSYNFLGQFWQYDQSFVEKLKKKFDVSRMAFNSGVMAFSTDIIKSDTLDQFRAIIDEYRHTICIAEQTVLNICFYDQWTELPAVYNICPNWEIGFRRCRPDELKGIILHCFSTFFAFSMNRKMWESGNALYPEWTANLAKADEIDFTKPTPPAKGQTRNIKADSEFLLHLPEHYPVRTMVRTTLNRIEASRGSKKKLWRMAVTLKDTAYKISRLPHLFKK